MQEPVLVVLAAGMGSRYGGLKQIDPMGPNGEIILELSCYDAKRAGFHKVVFIIKHAIEEEFKEAIGYRIAKHMEVDYVYQDLDVLPEGFAVPEGRTKPWGTAHALMCCKGIVDAPFAVINSDDYYGVSAFKTIYDFLVSSEDENEYAMVGYRLKNTVSKNGSVSRGVCQCVANELAYIDERKRIEVHGEKIEYSEDEGKTWVGLDPDSLVSMNLWGFKANVIERFIDHFPTFYANETPSNPLKCEYFIPNEVDRLLEENEAYVHILSSEDKWYGVTYQEDKPMVREGIAKLIEQGVYPCPLWEASGNKR